MSNGIGTRLKKQHDLDELILQRGPIDFIFAGWECQMVSKAGQGKSYYDRRFPYFFDLIGAINHLIRVQKYPPVFSLENTYPFGDLVKEIRDTTTLIKSFLGFPAVADACSFGSTAHRVRCLWTNWISPDVSELAIPETPELPPLSTILEPYHRPNKVLKDDEPPFTPVNKTGELRRALPTLVSYPGSYRFKFQGYNQPSPGMLYNTEKHDSEEANVWERERLMGFDNGDACAPGISENTRKAMLGRTMDRNMAKWLGGILMAIHALPSYSLA